ncbi:dihydrofolate reductase family protein [Agromyces endophyticus]|uniref:dihydrofolate reductase family protein n=1 Tax=Agromyces sp. H17E-10 TaxID=2932244 RepID=UPI001FD18721|nr:dihydrofolate reductase family protein [Agromyces sp. H17E-10]UOQ90761.1 dihydrofolate reductase family protein [Agromyces sp. H17E-10]
MRELVYYVAVSLDGFIAGPNGEFDAFDAEGDHMATIYDRYPELMPTAGAAALGVDQSTKTVDTVVMGWNTYAVGLPFDMTSPYSHLRQIVFSRSHQAEGENLVVTADDPVEVVRSLKAEDGAGIWLCGGGSLAGQLVDEIDRLVLKVNPKLFGDGVPLFAGLDYRPRGFEPVVSTPHGSGVVIAEFARTR